MFCAAGRALHADGLGDDLAWWPRPRGQRRLQPRERAPARQRTRSPGLWQERAFEQKAARSLVCALNTLFNRPTITSSVCTVDLTNHVTASASKRDIVLTAHFCKRPRGCVRLSEDTLKL